jgi:hypothetical protein
MSGVSTCLRMFLVETGPAYTVALTGNKSKSGSDSACWITAHARARPCPHNAPVPHLKQGPVSCCMSANTDTHLPPAAQHRQLLPLDIHQERPGKARCHPTTTSYMATNTQLTTRPLTACLPASWQPAPRPNQPPEQQPQPPAAQGSLRLQSRAAGQT